jgi:hypothetical protein
MSLNRGEINPLSLLKLRRLNFIPQHFKKLQVINGVDTKLIDQWINFNLNSRYALKKTLTLDINNKIVEVLEIGIEDPREITMLSLGCPYLHNQKDIF